MFLIILWFHILLWWLITIFYSGMLFPYINLVTNSSITICSPICYFLLRLNVINITSSAKEPYTYFGSDGQTDGPTDICGHIHKYIDKYHGWSQMQRIQLLYNFCSYYNLCGASSSTGLGTGDISKKIKIVLRPLDKYSVHLLRRSRRLYRVSPFIIPFLCDSSWCGDYSRQWE